MSRRKAGIAALLLAAMAGASSPVLAQTLAELDALASRSAGEQSGIALAQEQAARGELLEAIGTLERVLSLNPKSSGGRILHAFYLCRVDDRAGGAAEVGKLKKKDYAKDLWARVRSQCGMAGEG